LVASTTKLSGAASTDSNPERADGAEKAAATATSAKARLTTVSSETRRMLVRW
jgi:hypothetical protein